MNYQVFREFPVPRTRVARGHAALNFSKEALDEFWAGVDDLQQDPSLARGCYVFAVRDGRGDPSAGAKCDDQVRPAADRRVSVRPPRFEKDTQGGGRRK